MPRLNNQAFDILRAEVQRLTSGDSLRQVQRDIVLRRLERLRSQEGEPATFDELRDAIVDIFPEFSEQVLRSAARANAPASNHWWQIKLAAIALVGIAGGLWILNLPYPMIRRPVARVAPIVLLPSFMSMDYNYRQAISLVEQADQLVNNATSAADFDLGEEKVRQAGNHLNALPVWFLGYEPQRYCTFMSCSWQFTLDEFRAARASIGRMEAKIFQEKNAYTALEQHESALSAAKQQYQQAQTPSEQAQAIATWQAELDALQQIPVATLAGRLAQTKLVAYTRDFQQVTGLVAGATRSNTLIQAAKQFAAAAATAGQDPPHPVTQWENAATLWREAIDRLTEVSLEDEGYNEAQRLLAQYQTNLGIVQTRLETEQASVRALEQAKQEIETLLAIANQNNSNQVNSRLQRIINQLEQVQPGTTAYSEAEKLLQSARNKLQPL